MSTKLLSVFSRDIFNLLENLEEFNVTIHVGEQPNVRIFHAHSLILKARSSYFNTALSKQWAKQKDEKNILNQPNISPEIFEIILRTITEILEILSAGDELLLNDLLDYIQDYLVDTKADWLPNYILEIYRKTLDHQSLWSPFRLILPPNLEDDIVRCHLKQGSKPIYGINTPRGNSTLIGHKEMLHAKVSRVSRFNYAITLKDDSYGPCFGDKDLWMYGNFDKPESCSSKEDDYETWITKSRKFGVSEYEVFKIIKK
nr:7361_t:CDS:2 [Entrophospora candida]